ncbi:MAG: DNA alkylation repair protein [Candidatus Solibacter usitatus]|nr:DNA alkylation repair protein [Candidatus Solibacter usitatus]
MTPQQLARQARAAMKVAADPQVAASQRRFFKPWEKVYVCGISTPGVRRIARELHQQIRQTWTYANAVSFCDILMHDRYIEARSLGLTLLIRYQRHFQATLAADAKRWLLASRCDNWALTDALSMQILSPLLEQFPPLAKEYAAWTTSPNLWVRRAGVVAFVKPARKGAHLDTVYRLAAALAGDQEDLMHKASGWLLREAGKTDPRRLEQFLLAQGPTLPRTTVRYAIERFPETRRRKILARTLAGSLSRTSS